MNANLALGSSFGALMIAGVALFVAVTASPPQNQLDMEACVYAHETHRGLLARADSKNPILRCEFPIRPMGVRTGPNSVETRAMLVLEGFLIHKVRGAVATPWMRRTDYESHLVSAMGFPKSVQDFDGIFTVNNGKELDSVEVNRWRRTAQIRHTLQLGYMKEDNTSEVPLAVTFNCDATGNFLECSASFESFEEHGNAAAQDSSI